MISDILMKIMISSNHISSFTNFRVVVTFATKLIALRILFLTALVVAVVAKLVILGVLVLTSIILALRAVVVIVVLE